METTQPLVSVYVISYNLSRYVVECLDSIFNQTYQNIELVISDDCSSDDTVIIINNWLEIHRNRFTSVQFLTASKNAGMVQNRIKAENACTGDYIKPIDIDDYMDRLFVEKCVNVFLLNPDCNFLYTSSLWLCEDNNNKLVKYGVGYYKSGYLFKELFMLEFWIFPCSWMMSRKLAKEIPFDKSVYVDDYLRLLRIASKYSLNWVDEFLVIYRIRSGSGGKGSIRNFYAQLETINFFKDFPLYSQRREIILKYLSDCAEVQQPVYLLKMAVEFKRFSYVKKYYSIIRREARAAIKKTKVFQSVRQTWFFRKLKGEI